MSKLAKKERERIAREARIADQTVWPVGDSWIRGYALDVPKLLAEIARLERQVEREQERLRYAARARSKLGVTV